MIPSNRSRQLFSFLLPIGLLIVLLSAGYWNAKTDALTDSPTNDAFFIRTEPKHKGAHLFGRTETIDFEALRNMNIEWITLVSWGYQEDCSDPVIIHHHGDSLMLRERNAHWHNRIQLIREEGFKVFVKPHIWITQPKDGKWRSDIFPTNEENWLLWKDSYREFILRYAKIAEEAGAEMFCIGAEFTKLTAAKPDYWKKLIKEVRNVYSGQITYAANWYQEYEKIQFWKDLDYIGIQAYFPLTKKKSPTVAQVSKGWRNYIPTLKKLHKKNDRRILFTEMGYKSIAESAIRPWDWMEKTDENNMSYSPETQANCYHAFFNSIWENDWFGGVHIWQLRSGHTNRADRNDLNFTPQGKPAAEVIAQGFE
ncbi:MAG: glycoside hydrolase TIM-barrel-like domain-containing protein [Bacteroidota bacterium]